jgi:hypothetical protein
MSVEYHQDDDDLLTVTIRGQLDSHELAVAQYAAAAALHRKSGLCILVRAESFEGWVSGGDWGDLSFQSNDVLINKMAIVAEPKWKDSVLLFVGKNFRKFPIEFFASSDIGLARAWLAEGSIPRS